jgi:hypothetical protein
MKATGLIAICVLAAAASFPGGSASAQKDDEIIAGNPAVAPLKWVGLLVFETTDGKTSSCTAQFISPRVILTAAHCVQDNTTGKWYDQNKMYFLLQYQNRAFSASYRPVCLANNRGWSPPKKQGETQEERARALWNAYQYDYAMLLLDKESLTGSFKWTSDWYPRYQRAVKIGYPGAISSGQIVQRDPGSLGSRTDMSNVVMLQHDNPNMTQGTSGGAWVANFNTVEGPENNVIVGLTSFGFPTRWPGTTFGPYFMKDRLGGLLEFVSNGCKTQQQ